MKPFTDEWDWKSYCDPGHLHYFSQNSLASLLFKSGYQVDLINKKII